MEEEGDGDGDDDAMEEEEEVETAKRGKKRKGGRGGGRGGKRGRGAGKKEAGTRGKKDTEKEEEKKEYYLPIRRKYPSKKLLFFSPLIPANFPNFNNHIQYFNYWLHNAWPIITYISSQYPSINIFSNLLYNKNPIPELAK